jgi:deoxyribodipyrimidine photo-lyase
MRGMVWFRRDLRLHDQLALSAACQECDEVVVLFVFDEPLLQSHQFGPACVNFMLGCLEELAFPGGSWNRVSVASRRAS